MCDFEFLLGLLIVCDDLGICEQGMLSILVFFHVKWNYLHDSVSSLWVNINTSPKEVNADSKVVQKVIENCKGRVKQ